jgi:beta-glucosidase
MKKEYVFPEGFLWGTATSSYQVEGGIENCNWSKDFPAGRACAYYENYEEYFSVAKQLNQNVHRLSLEWSRIEPQEGQFDLKAIEHYKKMLSSLREKDIKTMVTLWHSTNPIWLSEKGGWTNPKTPIFFRNYVAFTVKELDAYVDLWVTVNEPMISASHSYLLGKFPPQRKNDFLGCARAIRNFAVAHRLSYAAIKKVNPQAPVTFVENYSFTEAYDTALPLNEIAVYVWNYMRNRMFLEYNKRYIDYLGVNYYFHERLRLGRIWPFISVENENKQLSDLGWEIYPQGLYEVLIGLKKYSLPIYITENGIADKADSLRADFIKQHLQSVQEAIADGADVRGYLYWSLLDNFEWADGFVPRFGLLEMDFEKVSYRIRPSASAYAAICKDNKLIMEK